MDDLAVELDPHRERHALLDDVVLSQHPVDGRREVRALGLGEEADVAEVDAEQRRLRLAGQFRRAQDRAIAAEHDRDFDVGRGDILTESRERRQLGRRHREVVVLVERHHRHQASRDELPAHLHARLRASPSRPVCATTRMWRSAAMGPSRRGNGRLSQRAGIALLHSVGSTRLRVAARPPVERCRAARL